MNDQEIRYYLLGYITEEMKVLDERELAGYGHEFSKRFHRKMKKIFWSEKYFGKHLHLAYAVRKIAAVVAIVAGLFAANQVSAKIFGINPWKYITSLSTSSFVSILPSNVAPTTCPTWHEARRFRSREGLFPTVPTILLSAAFQNCYYEACWPSPASRSFK